MRKIFFAFIIFSVIFSGCGEKKILHCDSCGKEIVVGVNDKMDEDWIIYCEKCNEELFGDDPLFNPQK